MTIMAELKGRSIDHLVLPVASLDIARKRYEALGFQVAPIGLHPFCTENACSWFDNETYLEPLAIKDYEVYQASFDKGIPFVRQDQQYRELVGDDGFSIIAFSTNDAERDYDHFVKTSYGYERLFEFSRPGKTKDGDDCTYSFKGAFAIDKANERFSAFTLERYNVPSLKDAPISKHPNKAMGVTGITLIADNPIEHEAYLNEICGVLADETEFQYQLGNAQLAVLTPQAFEAHYGYAAPQGNELKAYCVEIAVNGLDVLLRLAKQNGNDYKRIETTSVTKLIIPPCEGQGFVLSFTDVTKK
jgi:hypothetical protein